MPADTWAARKARERYDQWAKDTENGTLWFIERAIRDAIAECARICDDDNVWGTASRIRALVETKGANDE